MFAHLIKIFAIFGIIHICKGQPQHFNRFQ